MARHTVSAFVVIILGMILMDTNSLSVSEFQQSLEAKEKLKTQLKLFSGCHTKFITLAWASFSWSADSLKTKKFIQIFTEIDSTPLSFEHFNLTELNSQKYWKPHQNRNHHTPKKFTACFINVIIPHENTFQFLSGMTIKMQNRGEWPNHAILVDTFDNQNPGKIKFMFSVRLLYFRGLFLLVDTKSQNIQTICIPCIRHGAVWSKKVTLSEFKNLQEAYMKTSFVFYSNLQNSPIWTDVTLNLDYCNFMEKSSPSVVYIMHMICISYLLSSKYNYTASRKTGTNAEAQNYMYFLYARSSVNTVNLQNSGVRDRRLEWLPFGIASEHISFIAFQRQPYYSGNILKPFDWRGWTLLALSNLGMFLITVLYTCPGNTVGFFMYLEVGSSVVASVLDQSPSTYCKITGELKLCKSQILSVVWVLWLLLLVVLVNGYRGALFSFLTTDTLPDWPKSLKDVTSDNEYCALSTLAADTFNNSQLIKVSSFIHVDYLAPLMVGSPGVDYPNEYAALNQTLIFLYHLNETDAFLSKMVFKSSSQRSETGDPFVIGDHVCKKFVLFHVNVLVEAISLLYSFSTSIISDQVMLPQFRVVTPPRGMRNFFNDPFLRGIAALESSGILQALHGYVLKWSACIKVRKRMSSLKSDEKHVRLAMSKCIQQGSGFETSKFHEKSSPVVFSFRQLGLTFNVFGVGMCFAFFILVLELLTFTGFKFLFLPTKIPTTNYG